MGVECGTGVTGRVKTLVGSQRRCIGLGSPSNKTTFSGLGRAKRAMMTRSMPAGLLVLAMLVGQVAGFAKVFPKDAAEKSGDVRASRHMAPSPNTCMGRDSSTWKDYWEDGCDWYAELTLGAAITGTTSMG